MRKCRRIVTWVLGVAAFGLGPGRAAEERFSTAVPAAEYTAAGLAKLSPEELVRLDALVRDFKSGALAQARREAEAAAKAQAEAEVRVAQAEAEARAARAEAQVRAAAVAKPAAATAPAEGTVTVAPGTKVKLAT